MRRALGTLLTAVLILAVTGLPPAQAAPSAHPAAAATPTNPYGNPFNDYLRRPYGVLASQQEQATLPPVTDNPDEPFDWYRYPRAAIGVYGGPERAIITPEGYLQTEFGALTFATGSTPVDQRVKTWADGYLPILDERFTTGGLHHQIEFFSATVPGLATVPYTQSYGLPAKTTIENVPNMVSFARVTLTNPSRAPLSERFSASLDTARGVGGLYDRNVGPATPADPTWDPATRSYGGDGKLLLVADDTPSATNGSTVDYDVTLPAGASRTLTFAMPYFVGQQSDLSALAGAGYDSYRARTAAFWHQTLDRTGSRLTIPGGAAETKVLDTYKANLAFSLMLMNVIGGRYFWNANPTVYDHYWIRDTAFDIDGVLDAGFTDVARQVTLEILDWQSDSGEFVSQGGEHDGNGEALWAFANYYDRTHDQAFARQVWPAVQRAMAWEWQVRQEYRASDGGLFPRSAMSDNEGVRGHVLTYDLWNIAGEQAAADIADAVGQPATARQWRDRRTRYVGILRQALAPAVAQLGFIPPAVEGMAAPAIRNGWYGGVYGVDWGNLEAVWPSGAFAPDDPWVTASLAEWQAKTFEGVFGYAQNGVESTLHSYTPMSLSVTDVLRGDQQAALSSLYSLLVHTSATDMTSEGMSAAERWGWSATDQTQPHAEFSGKYLTLLRDMLAYESGDTLHLANVWSPVWSAPGRTSGFSGTTDFGPVSYTARTDSRGATFTLAPPTRNAPRHIVLSAPEGTRIDRSTVDGRAAGTVSGNTVTLNAPRHRVTIRLDWHRTRPQPALSYTRAVTDYLADYRKMTSPVAATVSTVGADHASVAVGQPLAVTATVRNTGGAGYLADPRAVLYVDGTPTTTDSTTFARGIGFDTPSSVVSFGHHDEGTVPVTFRPQLCSPGRHVIGVGLGSSPPDRTVTVDVQPATTASSPSASVTVASDHRYLDAGTTATVTATVTNTGCLGMTGTAVALSTPDGWTARPTGTGPGDLPPGGTATLSWQVTPPATPADPDVTATLTATATFGGTSGGAGTAAGSTPVTAFAQPSSDYRWYASTAAHAGQVGDRYSIYAGGADQWRGTDQFGTLYKQGAGTADLTVTTEVTSQDATGAWAKAGIVVRNDLSTARSPGYVILSATPSNGVVMQWDSNGDGLLDATLNTGFSAYPTYLKLARHGTTFTGYASRDGRTWTQVAQADVPSAAATQDVGLSAAAVSGTANGPIGAAEFTGFTIT